jgi:catechol-2,3-dioxygenase
VEFVESGVLMGVGMYDPTGSVGLALRHDPVRAAALAGFDPVALRVPTPAALDAWLKRLEDLGEPHGGVITGHAGRVLVGLRDPDGIEVRLYLPSQPEPEEDR